MAENAPDWAKSEGVGSEISQAPSWAQSTPQENSQPVMLDEAVKQKRSEAVQGVKRGIYGGIGLPGDIMEFINNQVGSSTGHLPTSEELGQAGEKYLGIEAPKGKSDKVVEFLSNPLSYLGGGSLLSKIVGAGAGGVGADVGERVGGTPAEIIGALAGGSLAGMKGGKPLSVGMQTPTERQAAANYLKSEGVTDLRAGQQTGSKPLQRAEGQLGSAPLSGGVADEKFNNQMRQFTRAALKRAGESSETAGPEVVDRAYERIGKEFDRLEANVMLPDAQFKSDLQQAKQDYFNLTSEQTRKPFIGKIIDEFDKKLTTQYGGTRNILPGEAYKSMRSQMNKLRRGTTDPEYKDALQDVINAMDGAMERTLAITNPSELGAWREVRRQYRNMLVIEKAVTGAGETKAQGLITPQSLRGALTQQSRRSYARGKGDFHDLARAGELLMTPPKSSGTAENIRSITLPGMAAGIVGRALHSDVVQNILKNRRQTPVRLPQKDYTIRALVNALGDQNQQ